MLDRSALLVIDLQRVFTDRDEPAFVRDSPAAVRAAVELVEGFRSANRPIVYTRHAHDEEPVGSGMGSWWSSFVIEGSPASRLDPALQPTQDELVLRKHHYSAFRETELASWLRARSVDTLVLSGTMTHICVDTTARDGFMNGFDIVVATDACASKHEALHRSALDGLSHAVARMATTAEVLHRLDGLR